MMGERKLYRETEYHEVSLPSPKIIYSFSYREPDYYCGELCFRRHSRSDLTFLGNGSESPDMTNREEIYGYDIVDHRQIDSYPRPPSTVYVLELPVGSAICREIGNYVMYSFSECKVIRSIAVTDDSAMNDHGIRIFPYIAVCESLHCGGTVADDPRIAKFSSGVDKENKLVVLALVSVAGNDSERFIQTLSAWLDNNWRRMIPILTVIFFRYIGSVEIFEYLWSLDLPSDSLWHSYNLIAGFFVAVNRVDYTLCNWLFEKMTILYDRGTVDWLLDDFYEHDIMKCIENLAEKYPSVKMKFTPGQNCVGLIQRILDVVRRLSCFDLVANMLDSDNVARYIRFPRRLWRVVLSYV